MTRKDYELIARTIREEREICLANYEPKAESGISYFALALARDLGNDNSRFDGLRFLRACGLSDEFISAQR